MNGLGPKLAVGETSAQPQSMGEADLAQAESSLGLKHRQDPGKVRVNEGDAW